MAGSSPHSTRTTKNKGDKSHGQREDIRFRSFSPLGGWLRARLRAALSQPYDGSTWTGIFFQNALWAGDTKQRKQRI